MLLPLTIGCCTIAAVKQFYCKFILGQVLFFSVGFLMSKWKPEINYFDALYLSLIDSLWRLDLSTGKLLQFILSVCATEIPVTTKPDRGQLHTVGLLTT